MKVYLAGPEVFLPNAREILDKKIMLTRAAGLDPLAPGDLAVASARTRREFGEIIYRVDEQLMMSADAVIANLTPFRGLHADAGTVFEVGFMRGRGKPVFAYSNVTDTYYERLLEYYDGQVTTSPDGRMRGPDGMLVEDFAMNDNLMLDGAIAMGGGVWVTRDVPDARLYVDTSAFEAVLTIATHQLLGRRQC